MVSFASQSSCRVRGGSECKALSPVLAQWRGLVKDSLAMNPLLLMLVFQRHYFIRRRSDRKKRKNTHMQKLTHIHTRTQICCPLVCSQALQHPEARRQEHHPGLPDGWQESASAISYCLPGALAGNWIRSAEQQEFKSGTLTGDMHSQQQQQHPTLPPVNLLEQQNRSTKNNFTKTCKEKMLWKDDWSSKYLKNLCHCHLCSEILQTWIHWVLALVLHGGL